MTDFFDWLWVRLPSREVPTVLVAAKRPMPAVQVVVNRTVRRRPGTVQATGPAKLADGKTREAEAP